MNWQMLLQGLVMVLSFNVILLNADVPVATSVTVQQNTLYNNDTIIEQETTKKVSVEPALILQDTVLPKKTDVSIGDSEKKDKKEGENPEDKKPKKERLIFVLGDSEFNFLTKFRPEFFYGKNLRLLNDRNPTDRVIFFRDTFDFIGEYHYGKASHKHDVAEFRIDIRNRVIWGDPESILLTTESPIRRLAIVQGEHRHGIARMILWIREIWLQLTLNDMLCLPTKRLQTVTMGAFPFELGRGIALGAVYGVGPDTLGYFAESSVDQYAFGAKFSGKIFSDNLMYEIYGAFQDNKASTFAYTNAKLRGQEYFINNRGNFLRVADDQRGFGIINYIVAAHLKYTFIDVCKRKFALETYIMFNDQREQRIEFTGDATSKLASLGLAGEFELNNFEFGFDAARNFGHQCVKGYDRNTIFEENRNGFEVVINTKVTQQAPDATRSAAALKVSENQNIIENSPPGEKFNGKVIGSDSLGTLTNASDRFRDPYKVLYKGSMFVADASYYFCKPDARISATVGYASGDENPHKNLLDIPDPRTIIPYRGFVSVQEAYSGIRVKSAFFLSGSGRIPRILSFPEEEENPGEFPSAVSNFTNLIFTGAGLYFKFPTTKHKWSFNPNVLSYWTDVAPILQRSPRRITAHRHLGIEINAFAEAELIPDLKFFFIGAIFFPGQLYKDIAGRALNREQQAFINTLKNPELDISEIRADRTIIPLLGKDLGYFINFGLDYRF